MHIIIEWLKREGDTVLKLDDLVYRFMQTKYDGWDVLEQNVQVDYK